MIEIDYSSFQCNQVIQSSLKYLLYKYKLNDTPEKTEFIKQVAI